jgi:hypothetical protein
MAADNQRWLTLRLCFYPAQAKAILPNVYPSCKKTRREKYCATPNKQNFHLPE